MWLVATILDSTTVSDGFKKYYVYFYHIRRNLDLRNAGIFWVLKNDIKEMSSFSFLFSAALRFHFGSHGHKITVPWDILSLFSTVRRRLGEKLGGSAVLFPKDFHLPFIDQDLSLGHSYLQEWLGVQVFLSTPSVSEKANEEVWNGHAIYWSMDLP